MRSVSLLLALALLSVHAAGLAQTDPSGRKLYQIKPPPPDSGATGIQQVGRIARPPKQPASASVVASSVAGCATSPATTQAATAGCSTTAQSSTSDATPPTAQASAGYQRLRIGKVDFDAEPNPNVNRAIKAAIIGAARPGVKPQSPPGAQRPPGGANAQTGGGFSPR